MNRQEPARWLRLVPFWRGAVALAAVGSISPGVIAIYYLSRGRWTLGTVVGAVWLVAFLAMTEWLHRHGRIHRGVLLGCAVCCLLVFGFAFFNEL